MAITAITSVQEFDEKVLGSKGLTIVDFWAGWCEPCIVMRPEVETVAEKLKGEVQFFTVDAEDKNLRGILLKEDIDGIPSLVFFRDGKMLDSLVGYKKADILEELIREAIK
ncbi:MULTISPECIES: co-chaperone YbbN [Veillonella]|uniref:thioredoxin family protein n=1 Tax=Veillonella TaxID=29465 RepID=UPI0003E23BE6|nr:MULTISPECIES: thioredoxin family protein [Veillonella]ETS93498.1 putative thioredoxin [Veillonella sp. AS16]